MANDLKRLAVVHRCALLVVNHVANWSKNTDTTRTAPLPALGRYWSSVPNLRLHIGKRDAAGNPSAFDLTIVRNLNGPVQKKCSFAFSCLSDKMNDEQQETR